MSKRVDDIVEKARLLTPEERLELFDRLEAIFAGDHGDGTPVEIENAWLDEAERRIAAFERGETVGETQTDVMRRLRERIEQK
jgi:hypothetical protein